MRQKLSDKLDALEDLVPLLNNLFTGEAILHQIHKMRNDLPKMKSRRRLREARIKVKMLVYFADSAFMN
jgi:hypothetical protein